MTRHSSQISFGESLFAAETGGFVVTETKHPPGLRLACHSHGHANLACVIEGTFTERIGRRTFRCAPRTLVVKPAGVEHSNEYGASGARCLIVEVRPQRLDDSDALARSLGEVWQADAGAAATTLANIRRELRARDSAAALAIEGLVLELLARLARFGARPAGGGSRRARDAEALIRGRFRERLRLSDVAAAVGVHPAHLARVFKERYRCSVGEYVRRLRLDHAERELASTDETIAAIAASAGFYDQSHFTNAFRRHTGASPAEYRSAARGRKSPPKPQ